MVQGMLLNGESFANCCRLRPWSRGIQSLETLLLKALLFKEATLKEGSRRCRPRPPFPSSNLRHPLSSPLPPLSLTQLSLASGYPSFSRYGICTRAQNSREQCVSNRPSSPNYSFTGTFMNRLHYLAHTHEGLQPTMRPMRFLATVMGEGKEDRRSCSTQPKVSCESRHAGLHLL